MASLEHRITHLWGEMTAATHQFLVLIAEFDDSKRWAGPGLVSCAQWLNLRCGIGEVEAREKLRVAHAIRSLPEIDAAFRAGQVSYSKVRAMTRVATPENEAILLNIARHGTASHVERIVRQFRRLERIEAAEAAAAIHRQRSVHFRHESDDSIVLRARLPVEVGELVRQAIDLAAELVEAESCSEPGENDATFDSFGRRRAEGLRLMAEQFLAQEERASRSGSDRYQVVVHVDQQLLADGETSGAGLCEVDNGAALSVETVRRLGCDGSLVGMLENEDGQPLSVGRKTRAIPVAIRRALKARDGGCRFPGCTHTRFTEGHHIEHWANGGETRLDNLITLCHFHHHLVHEGGYSIERMAQCRFRFMHPGGYALDDCRIVDSCFRGNISARNREAGVRIDPGTIDTRWTGERMDYTIAIDALIAARQTRENDRRTTP